MNVIARRLPVSLIVASCILVTASASPASAQLNDNPVQHQLSATSHGVIATAKPFTYCREVTDGVTGVGSCGDGVPGPAATRVPVHPGGSVGIFVGAPATTLTARYAAAGGGPLGADLAVMPLDESRQRFVVVLPAGRPAELLVVSTTYSNVPGAPGTIESGDAHFSIGLREHLHGKLQPGGVTAIARVTCQATAAGGRRCRVSDRGTIRPPASGAVDCTGGRMLVRVFVRGRRVVRASAPVTPDCRYRLAPRSFSLRRGNATAVVRTRFLGSSSLTARSAPAIRIRVR